VSAGRRAAGHDARFTGTGADGDHGAAPRETNVKRLQFSIDIRASRQTVWQTMLAHDSYRLWTAEFAEGSYYEGVLEPGARLRFLVPSGHGMVSEVAECRPPEFLSLRHLGYVRDGVEDTESEMVRAWAPALEHYSLSYAGLSTHLRIDIEVTPEFEDYMTKVWPAALARLKRLCEDRAS
jgi:uncharacterized protein YndB with AHSA1/START domain